LVCLNDGLYYAYKENDVFTPKRLEIMVYERQSMAVTSKPIQGLENKSNYVPRSFPRNLERIKKIYDLYPSATAECVCMSSNNAGVLVILD
jgi:hypothetical protein